jgi:hypothetical protein
MPSKDDTQSRECEGIHCDIDTNSKHTHCRYCRHSYGVNNELRLLFKREINYIIERDGPSTTDSLDLDMEKRQKYIMKYGWFNPSLYTCILIDRAVNSSGGLALEIGAGMGFLAYIMRNGKGVKEWIVTDGMCGETFHKTGKPWVDVQHKLASDAVKEYNTANCLVIAWPECGENYATEALKIFTERSDYRSCVILWGERRGGCTGNDALYELLETKYRLDCRVDTDSWKHIYDCVSIYKIK